MASIFTPEEEENKEQQNQPLTSVQQTGGLTGSPSNMPAAPQANTTAMSAPQNRPKGSGRFTNIQRYLDANRGSGEQLAKGISRRGDEYAQGIREGIEAAQGVRQGIESERQRLGRSEELAQGIRDDAVATAQNELDAVTRLRMGQSDVDRLRAQGTMASRDIQGNLNPLQRFTENLGTESGRFKVLQDVYSRPDYSMGQRRLDQLFLQADPSNTLGQVQQQLSSSVSQGQDQLANLQGQVSRDVGALQDLTGQAREQILGAIGDFTRDGQGELGEAFSDLAQAQTQRERDLQNMLEQSRRQFLSGNISADLANQLGIAGTQIADLDLATFSPMVRVGDEDVTMADVASESDLARLNALAQLAGTDPSEFDLGEVEGQDLAFDSDRFRSEAQNRVRYLQNLIDSGSARAVSSYVDPDRFGGPMYRTVDNRSISQIISDSPEYRAGVNPNAPIEDQINQALSNVRNRPLRFTGDEEIRQQQIRELESYLQAINTLNRTIGNASSPNDLERGGYFNVK